MDLAAERAEGLAGNRLFDSVNALADDGLFLFTSVNDAGCQAVLCCPGPNYQLLGERLVSQAGGLMSDPGDEPGCAKNFVDAVATPLRQQRPQFWRTIEWFGQLPVLPTLEAAP